MSKRKKERRRCDGIVHIYKWIIEEMFACVRLHLSWIGMNKNQLFHSSHFFASHSSAITKFMSKWERYENEWTDRAEETEKKEVELHLNCFHFSVICMSACTLPYVASFPFIPFTMIPNLFIFNRPFDLETNSLAQQNT